MIIVVYKLHTCGVSVAKSAVFYSILVVLELGLERYNILLRESRKESFNPCFVNLPSDRAKFLPFLPFLIRNWSFFMPYLAPIVFIRTLINSCLFLKTQLKLLQSFYGFNLNQKKKTKGSSTSL